MAIQIYQTEAGKCFIQVERSKFSRKEKNYMLRLLRSVIAIFYLWNCNGKIHVSFAVAPQTTRVMVGLCDTNTTKMKKALSPWNT